MAESSKRRGKRQIRPLPDLPEDVITDILTCLPVKSLLRFRSVSKRFLTLIDGPDFIKRHLNRSLLTKSNHKLILGGYRYKRRPPNPHLYSVDLYKPNQTVQLDNPCGTKILGSVNGILCLTNNGEKDIVFWNLATRNYHKLPLTENEHPDLYPIVYGFGYDSVSDDYKLLRLVRYRNRDSGSFCCESKLYSLKSNSWLRIQDCPFYLFFEEWYGELACGAVHWVVYSEPTGNLIAAFHLATNEFRLVDYPEFLEKEILSIVNLEGRLCMLCHKYGTGFEQVDVWVMKDYGAKESWSKQFTVSQPKVNCLLVSSNPLAYSRSGTEIMLVKDCNKIFWYSIKEGRLRTINIRGCGDYFEPVVCVESLVPLSGKAGDYAKKIGEKEKQIKGVKTRGSS